jgi:hypothetical protein
VGGSLVPKNANLLDAHRVVPAIYLWKLGEQPQFQRPKLSGDVLIASYCATADGWVRYVRQKIDGTLWHPIDVVEGYVGHEQAGPVPLEETTGDARGLANYDIRAIDAGGKCRKVQDERMAGRIWVADTYRQYILDFGAIASGRMAEHPLVLMHYDGSGRTELPISASQVQPRCTHFHRFEKVFYVWDCMAVGARSDSVALWRANGNCWPYWRIDPSDGTVQKSCITGGDWVGNGVYLLPTKAGFYYGVSGSPFAPPGGLRASMSRRQVVRNEYLPVSLSTRWSRLTAAESLSRTQRIPTRFNSLAYPALPPSTSVIPNKAFE